MAEKFVGRAIQDPRERLVALVAANMLKEPNYYSAEDQKKKDLMAALESVVITHPEFVCQLAYYAREKMNIRSTSNFLIAFCASRPQSKPFLPRYFRASVRLPTDLLEVVQHVQELTSKVVPEGHYYVPKSLKREVKLKFKDFNLYQLGKYCSEGKRKRLAKKLKSEKETAPAKLQLAMKRLVRLCHISEPADVVCSLIGKRYPSSPEEYAATSLSSIGPFDPSRANKRMKIPTPITWETELSSHGNKPEVWESLMRERKLPFMAMLRNIRNMLITGVDRATHEMVIERLRDPRQVEQSRLFPFRFFSAFEAIKVDVGELRKLKDDPTYEPPQPEGKRGLKSRSVRPRRGRSSRGRGRGHGGSVSPPPDDASSKPRPKIIPKEVPTEALLEAYKSALETSVKLATTANVLPVLGHSVIFCDVSGSMGAKLSGGSGLGSVRTCKDAGILLGLMLRYVCESSEVIAFSSPGQHSQCWIPIELSSENILENMESVKEQSSVLGGGTDFPYDYIRKLISEKKHVDQMFVFSDMMIAPGDNEMNSTKTGGKSSISNVLNEYRENANPNMKFVTVDLAVGGRDILGASYGDDFLNLKVYGYSDSILALVSEFQKSQIEAVESFALENLVPKP